MIQLYRDIEAQLKAEVPELKFVGMLNDQFAQMEDGSIYSFPLPAIFIEFEDDLNYVQLGGGYQLIDPLFVNIHIAHDMYNANTALDQLTEHAGEQELNLTVYALRQKIYKALQKFEPLFAVQFMRVNETQDKSHTNLYRYIQRYQTNYIDNERSEPINGIIKQPPTGLDLAVYYTAPLPPPPYIRLADNRDVVTSLTLPSYVEGSGPSGNSTPLKVIADGLNGTPASLSFTSFIELSADGGITFVSGPANIPYSGISIYTPLSYLIRAKKDLPFGNYAGEITLSGGGASDSVVDVSCEITSSVSYIIAYGGFEYVSGGFKYHKIYKNDTFNVVFVPSENNKIEIEMGGGGGGGGCQNGGSGGGAGGWIYEANIILTTGLKPCVVGLGGVGAFGDDNAQNGGNTTFLGFTAIGGGRGRSGGYGVTAGGNGGSGGGGARSGLGGMGTQGYNGGNSTSQETAGGGGASEAGGNGAPGLHGKGGDGVVSPIDGIRRLGGGGGGATDGTGTPGVGGLGGGGNGMKVLPGVNGEPNTGSGGGGSGLNDKGGDGGNGYILIKYPFVEPTDYSLTTNNIINYTSANTRYDAASCIQMQNGVYLLAFSRYGTSPDDSAPADIVFYTSTDCITWTYLTFLNSAGNCFVIPSLYQRDNGDIICIYYETVSGGSRIRQQISTNNGATWGSASTVRQVLNEFVAMASDVIYKTATGRLLLPIYIQTGLNTYNGYVMYSDDEGATWNTSVSVITPSDGTCDEAGIYTLPDGLTLVRYARGKAGANCVWASNSTDDGLTWGTSYKIPGLLAKDSQTFIKKIGSVYVACFNPNATGRNLLVTAVSNDGITFYPNTQVAYNSDTIAQYIEPALIAVGNKLMIFYADNSRDGAGMNYDLKQAVIPIQNYTL